MPHSTKTIETKKRKLTCPRSLLRSRPGRGSRRPRTECTACPSHVSARTGRPPADTTVPSLSQQWASPHARPSTSLAGLAWLLHPQTGVLKGLLSLSLPQSSITPRGLCGKRVGWGGKKPAGDGPWATSGIKSQKPSAALITLY